MAVNLEMTYGKKLGLPQYSSHFFDVSLKTEVAHVEDIRDEVKRVYHILQASVDQQIVDTGFIPGQSPAPTTNGSNGSAWRCSDKQKNLILKLVEENKLDRNVVEQLAVDRFGHGVRAINRLEASGLIEELFEQTGKNKRKRGRPTRRAA